MLDKDEVVISVFMGWRQRRRDIDESSGVLGDEYVEPEIAWCVGVRHVPGRLWRLRGKWKIIDLKIAVKYCDDLYLQFTRRDGSHNQH